jgi:hypothetical protein
VEQVGISGPCEVRNLVAHSPVMSLQAKCESGDDEEEKDETSHGSNLAARDFLPPVADMTQCERKLPSQTPGPQLAFCAIFCLHSQALDNVLVSVHSGE